MEVFINFCVEIDAASASKLLELVSNVVPDGCTKLHLCINSPGGNVRVAIGCASFLKALPCEIVTYNIARVDSAAILLFSIGDKRICCPQSCFYAHSMSVVLNGNYTCEKLRAEVMSLRRDLRSSLDFLTRSTKIAKTKWKLLMSEMGTYIDAKNALDLGLATEIKPFAISNDAILLAVTKDGIRKQNKLRKSKVT